MYKQRRQKQEVGKQITVPNSDPKVGRPCGAFATGDNDEPKSENALCKNAPNPKADPQVPNCQLSCGRITSGNEGSLSCQIIPNNGSFGDCAKTTGQLRNLGIKPGEKCEVDTLIDGSQSGQYFSRFEGTWESVGGKEGYKCKLTTPY